MTRQLVIGIVVGISLAGALFWAKLILGLIFQTEPDYMRARP